MSLRDAALIADAYTMDWSPVIAGQLLVVCALLGAIFGALLVRRP